MSSQTPYIVLARKYRPNNFDDLIGQEVLVRILTNSIANGRIAHAFLLTGIRGVGKTTTARIMAKALNCLGEDGKSELPTNPCGKCQNCKDITNSHHPDVIELDAASNTGVDDIRNIIDETQYSPMNARYKVFIIDEVHMLSKNAFNALLKTLEEPPPHVKFIFATTELNKIPITILSRCQRFELKRIDNDILSEHLANIARKEQIEYDPEALQLIANASEGSARDALSLLDQAIAISYNDNQDSSPGHKVSTETVEQMLGIDKNNFIIDLLSSIINQDTGQLFEIMAQIWQNAIQPIFCLQQLLDLCHQITKMKVMKNADIGQSHNNISNNDRLISIAEQISMVNLGRIWQLLLKGIDECQIAPNQQQALEMVLLRIIHLSHMPDPAQLTKYIENNIQNFGQNSGQNFGQNTSQNSGNNTATPQQKLIANDEQPSELISIAKNQPANQNNEANIQSNALPPAINIEHIGYDIDEFAKIINLLEDAKEIMLAYHLQNDVSVVSFSKELKELEIYPLENAPGDIAAQLTNKLSFLSKIEWQVKVSERMGSQPYSIILAEIKSQKLAAMSNNQYISEILDSFEGAQLIDIKNI